MQPAATILPLPNLTNSSIEEGVAAIRSELAHAEIPAVSFEAPEHQSELERLGCRFPLGGEIEVDGFLFRVYRRWGLYVVSIIRVPGWVKPTSRGPGFPMVLALSLNDAPHPEHKVLGNVIRADGVAAGGMDLNDSIRARQGCRCWHVDTLDALRMWKKWVVFALEGCAAEANSMARCSKKDIERGVACENCRPEIC